MCSNIIHLKICTQVSQLQKLQLSTKGVERFELLAENIYFPLKYTSKLIQQFPSLIDIQLQVLSFDTCVHLVDILLDGLVNLLHLKIYFIEDTILDNRYLHNYVIEKRRQAFPFNEFNEHKVVVKINKDSLEIYL